MQALSQVRQAPPASKCAQREVLLEQEVQGFLPSLCLKKKDMEYKSRRHFSVKMKLSDGETSEKE